MTKKHKSKQESSEHEEKEHKERRAKQHEHDQSAQGEDTCGEECSCKHENEQPDYYTQLVQLKADFENYRKRMEREKPSLVNWGKMDMLLKFLPLYDTVISACQEAEKIKDGPMHDAIKPFFDGLELIRKEYQKVFDCEGISVIDEVNVPYDPMIHEVMTVVEGNDENDGKVVMVFQKGFKSCDKVIRPARVALAKKKQAAPKTEEEASKGGDTQEAQG